MQFKPSTQFSQLLNTISQGNSQGYPQDSRVNKYPYRAIKILLHTNVLPIKIHIQMMADNFLVYLIAVSLCVFFWVLLFSYLHNIIFNHFCGILFIFVMLHRQ